MSLVDCSLLVHTEIQVVYDMSSQANSKRTSVVEYDPPRTNTWKILGVIFPPKQAGHHNHPTEYDTTRFQIRTGMKMSEQSSRQNNPLLLLPYGSCLVYESHSCSYKRAASRLFACILPDQATTGVSPPTAAAPHLDSCHFRIRNHTTYIALTQSEGDVSF